MVWLLQYLSTLFTRLLTYAKITMSYSLGLSKMIVFVFIFIIVFVSHDVYANFELLDDLSGREEWIQGAGYGEEKLSTVLVGGTIFCHGSEAKNKTSLHPYPVSGS